ncbi:MAG: hypothetical protein ABSF37_00245 [Sedimentisphaerales bacterium]|jgi:hypothetical protein
MNLHSINPRASIITAAFILLSFAGIAICSDTDNPAVNSQPDNGDPNGPTVSLSYDGSKPVKNPSSSFMYFIPLVAPTRVDMDISPNNQQQAWIVSYDKKVTKKTFYVTCEFQMQGAGFFKTTLDSDEIIASFREEVKKGDPVKNALDFINFQGEGIGRLEAWGTINDSNETVNEVQIHFNIGGHESPVTIGLYSVSSENGRYDYSKRYNELVARAATLTFKKCRGEPKMDVAVASVNNASDPNGFFGGIVGFFANFFIPPTRISIVGNDTMLNFGYAMFKQKTTFTFPKATNIKPPKPAANK